MAAGDVQQRTSGSRSTRRSARPSSCRRVEFSVFVGTAEGEPRAFATRLHNSLVAPARSILIMVDPDARALEIVTGGYVRRTLSDHEVELAALEMQTAFAAGDLVGGLKRGIEMLAEHARPAEHPARRPVAGRRRRAGPHRHPVGALLCDSAVGSAPGVLGLRGERARPRRRGPRARSAWRPGWPARSPATRRAGRAAPGWPSGIGNMYSSAVEARWVPFSSQIVSAAAR